MQIGIVVSDVKARARAWPDTLGVPLPAIREPDGYEQTRAEYHGQPTTARARLAFLDLGQVTVELIEPIDAPSTWRDQLEQRGDSLHSIAIGVRDVDQAATHFASRGIPLVQSGEFPGGRYAYADTVPHLGAILEQLEFDRA